MGAKPGPLQPLGVLPCPSHSPSHPTWLWGAHQAPALLVPVLTWEGTQAPLRQDAPQGSENEAEPCTYHHLAGYVPDVPILAWLALSWLPHTADAPLL